MSLPDADPGPARPVLRLVDDMQSELDDDRRRLALLVEDARDVLAVGGGDARQVADRRDEILARLDRHAQALEHRQRAAARLIDEAVSNHRAAVAASYDENLASWAAPWRPPAGALADDEGVLTRLPVNRPGSIRPQLVRVLTIVGVLLIVSGLLMAAL
jgi:hypothetical protein